jgi:hypothetical protein
MARRIRLNPCDYLYFTHDQLLVSLGQTGHVTIMVMDVEGEIEPARLRAAVARAMQVHPILRARIRYNWLKGKPVWVTDDVSKPNGSDVAGHVVTCLDWRDRAEWETSASEWIAECYHRPIDVWRGPPVRVDYCAGPEGRGKICLRWPHALMDAEGAQWLLSEIDRMDEGGGHGPSDAIPPQLLPDGDEIDVLAGRSLRERVGLFRKALNIRRDEGRAAGPPASGGGESVGAPRLYVRVFEPAEVERIEQNARATCPPGQGIYARYLASCVLRSLHSVYTSRGVSADAYLITLPISARPPGPRPMHGNYLVALTFCGRRERMTDARSLAYDLHEQLAQFQTEGLAEANWALLWTVGLMRSWQYRLLLRLPIGLQRYASGFSYYGEIDPPLRRFVGARVSNLWGATPLSAPPGWNPAFSRFGDRINFTLTWLDGYIADDLAGAFAAGIEREALAGPSPPDRGSE